MFKKIKKFMLITTASFAMLVPGLGIPLVSGVASASITESLCSGTNVASSTSGTSCGSNTDNNGQSAIKDVAKTIINAFSVIVGAISVIMVIYGGFRYITSGGDSGRVGNAKNTLIYAIVGLIIVALAQVVVHYIINVSSNEGSQFVK